MKVLIAGAGRFGSQVAGEFGHLGNDITVIETDGERIAKLTGHLAARLVAGDACEPGILEEAGVLTTDLLIAATGDDEDNLVISLLAKRQFAVPRVAARVNDPENAWLFNQEWGVDVPLPASAPLISLVQEAAGSADTVPLLRLSKAGVNVIETVIGAHSRAAGRAVADVALPPATVVAAVIRQGRPVVPDAQFRLSAGDELLLVSETANADDVHAAFQ